VHTPGYGEGGGEPVAIPEEKEHDMSTTPQEPLKDDDIESTPSTAPVPGDADGTDGGTTDGDSPDGADADGTDGGDADGTDGTDGGDADGTDA
jgi:hypothetical protein